MFSFRRRSSLMMYVRCVHRHGEHNLAAIARQRAAAARSLHTSASPRLASPASAPFARTHPRAHVRADQLFNLH
jgi:hypothetical protein